jgi:hypothetical protein
MWSWSYLRELGANAAEQNDREARESDVTRVGNNERHNDRKLPTGYVILGFSFLFLNNAISRPGLGRHGRCTFNDALEWKRHL